MRLNKILFVLLMVLSLSFVFGCDDEKVEEKPEVSISEEVIDLEIGEDKVIVPVKTEGAVLEWTSSDNTVATVNGGKVVAVGEGTCFITVTVSGTDVKDELTVNVKRSVVLPEKVEVKGLATVTVNSCQTYTYVVSPSNAEYDSVKWSVSNSEVASIDQNGLLVALKEGAIRVICEIGNVRGEFEVFVKAPQPIEPTGINLYVNGEFVESGGTINITEFDSAQLTFEYLPKDTPILEGVDVSSGNEYTLSISEDYVITALVPGQTYLVVCSTYADIELSYNVVINEKHFLPESVTVTGTGTELLAGQTLTVEATVYPERASDEVVWSSSDENVATVDSNGVVTAVGVGEVKIIATTKELDTVKGQYTVTVKEAPQVTLDTVLVCPVGYDNVTEYDGKTYYKDLNMFDDIVKAVEKVEENGTVILIAGEHTLNGRAIINKTITVLGPNKDKKMGEERVEEAVVNIDGNSADKCAFEIHASGVVFNGVKFAGGAAQAHTFLAGDTLENFTAKSCYFFKINTPLESISKTSYKGTLELSDCYFEQLVQFVIWFKDGDNVSELSEVNVLNNKFFGEYTSYAGKGAFSLRTKGGNYTFNFKYNEVDLSLYTFSNNPYLIWVNSGTFEVKYNIFKAVPDGMLFGNTMTTTTVDSNIFLDAEGNKVATPNLGASITSTNDFESMDAYNEAVSKSKE